MRLTTLQGDTGAETAVRAGDRYIPLAKLHQHTGAVWPSDLGQRVETPHLAIACAPATD